MYTQWHALLRHCTSHCIFLLPVCNVTCFVAPLNISLCLFAACLRRYRLCSPVHQLQIGTALAATHVAVAGSTIIPAYLRSITSADTGSHVSLSPDVSL